MSSVPPSIDGDDRRAEMQEMLEAYPPNAAGARDAFIDLASGIMARERVRIDRMLERLTTPLSRVGWLWLRMRHNGEVHPPRSAVVLAASVEATMRELYQPEGDDPMGAHYAAAMYNADLEAFMLDRVSDQLNSITQESLVDPVRFIVSIGLPLRAMVALVRVMRPAQENLAQLLDKVDDLLTVAVQLAANAPDVLRRVVEAYQQDEYNLRVVLAGREDDINWWLTHQYSLSKKDFPELL